MKLSRRYCTLSFVPLLHKKRFCFFFFFSPSLPHSLGHFSNLVPGVSERRGDSRWSINTTCRYKCSSASVDKDRKWSWIPSVFCILSISRQQLQKCVCGGGGGKSSLSFPFFPPATSLKSSAGRHNQILSWLHPGFHAQEPRHTIAPVLLLHSGADNCIPKAPRQLRNIPLCTGSPKYNISRAHCGNRCMFSYIWPWLQKPSCMRADSAACQRVTWLLSCVVTGFADLHAQQPGDLKTREGGGVEARGWDGLPIIWCCLSCIIPRFQIEGNCWWSHGAEQLKTERERERRGGEEKEERPALFFGVSM